VNGIGTQEEMTQNLNFREACAAALSQKHRLLTVSWANLATPGSFWQRDAARQAFSTKCGAHM
jgi:hypothetical protein